MHVNSEAHCVVVWRASPIQHNGEHRHGVQACSRVASVAVARYANACKWRDALVFAWRGSPIQLIKAVLIKVASCFPAYSPSRLAAQEHDSVPRKGVRHLP